MLLSARFRIASATDVALDGLLTWVFMGNHPSSWKCVGGLPTLPPPCRSGAVKAARLTRACERGLSPRAGLDGENGGIPCPSPGKPYPLRFPPSLSAATRRRTSLRRPT